MSIKDYKKNYIVINGTTNEQIKIPKSNIDSIILKDLTINDMLLIETILAELEDTDTVTICRTYMKD